MSLYSKIFHKSKDGIVVIDIEGVITEANCSLCKIFGYDDGELTGKKINILMPSPHREAHDKYLREFRENSRPIRIEPRRVPAVKKDGTDFFVELGVFQLEGFMCAGIVRDVQCLEEGEKKKMQESEDRNLFAANISHELKTPLNSIINMNLLLNDDLQEISHLIPSEIYDRMMDRMDIRQHSGTLLLTQINDIVD